VIQRLSDKSVRRLQRQFPQYQISSAWNRGSSNGYFISHMISKGELVVKRVEIVCDCCGDISGTVEFIERISRVYNLTTDQVHEALYDDKGCGSMPRIIMEGCHVERTNSEA